MTFETQTANRFTASESIITEVIETVKPKVQRKRTSAYCNLEINLDAGANHVKGIVKFAGISQSIHFPSRARIVDGEISPDNVGNFAYDGTNYASGKSADYYKGEWLEAREGNKIDYLDVWFLSALTHAKKVLLETGKRRKSNTVVKLRCYIRLLTLSKERKGEIEKILKSIERFTFNNCEYEITIASLEVFTEGYGSAIAALNLDETANRINILDMGGGTLSFTSYRNLSH